MFNSTVTIEDLVDGILEIKLPNGESIFISLANDAPNKLCLWSGIKWTPNKLPTPTPIAILPMKPDSIHLIVGE